MAANEKRDRQSVVTDEPFLLHQSVKGRPLASLKRRAVALFIDAFICWLVLLPFLVALGLGVLYLRTPVLARGLFAAMSGAEVPTDESGEGLSEVVMIVASHRPEILPAPLAAAVDAGDADAVNRLLLGESFWLQADPLDGSPSYFDARDNTLHVHRDVFFGRYGALIGVFTFIIGYFTLATRIGRGKTPGKWMLGVRIVRLDGRPLTLGDTFNRSGGYAVGIATFLLGFFDTLWDPNLQAPHDKIARTVVVREPRG